MNKANTVIEILGIYDDITEKMKLRSELDQHKKKFTSVIQCTEEGFWLVSMDGRLKEVNPAYAQLSGYSMEELIGMHVTDLEALENPDETRKHIEKIIVNGADHFETLHHRKDGSLWNVAVRAFFINEDGGYFIAFFRNITQRKFAELALQESEGKLEALLNTSAIGIVMIDSKGLIEEFNPVCESMFGYAREDILGRNISVLMPEPNSSRHDGYINSYLRGNPGRIIGIGREVIAKHTDGSTFPMELLVGDVRLAGRQAFIGFVKDISERKRMEQELLIAATAFETLEGTMITDADKNIIRVNQAFTKITGYSPEDVLGKKPSILKSGSHHDDFYRDMYLALGSVGIWQGEILDRHKDGHIYPKQLSITAVKNESGIVTHYVGNFSDISERKAAEERIQNLAFYDTLTNLPNRRLLIERLEHAIISCARIKQHWAVLFLDLDNFKILNDTQGHQVGDELLMEVAKRLKSCVRDSDTVARLGGDEFVILLESLDEDCDMAAVQAQKIAEKISSELNEPYQLGKFTHRSSSSIGIVLFDNQDSTIASILAQADTAMYEAKKGGRNTFRFFNPTMQQNLEQRTAMESALRLAISKQQLRLVYQPQVDDKDTIVGAEALIRWQHPELGTVSPASFISLAEETGLILSIGSWVLEVACSQLNIWKSRPETSKISLSVNVSAKQFYQENFIDEVMGNIVGYDIEPKLLKLELTESMVLEDIEVAIEKMRVLRALGVHLAMDDFGTGYSSLSCLKRLPFDQLKIDKSFIDGIKENSDDAFIIHTVIALGQKLGMSVIAEGVEEIRQYELLKKLGCFSFQGYYFGKPMDVNEFEKML